MTENCRPSYQVKVWNLHFTVCQTLPYVKLDQNQIDNCEFIFLDVKDFHDVVISRKKGKHA